MISYVLILIVSLDSGQPVQAALEGPMAHGSCTDLIDQPPYRDRDETTRSTSSCVGWKQAQLLLARHSCTRPVPVTVAFARTRRFDCATDAKAVTSTRGRRASPRPAATPPVPVPAQDALDRPVAVPEPPAPVPVPVPTPVPASASPPQPAAARRERYIGVLVRDRAIIVAPRTFKAADCPEALDTQTGPGVRLHMRCLSLSAQQHLLAQAGCDTGSIDSYGTRRYACQDDPARYLGALSDR